MLKKKLGIEAIERGWSWKYKIANYFKTTSSLTIPDSCERIGGSAFYECDRLKEVVISEGVKSIRGCAFCYCRKLKKVVIPDSVENIFDYAFAGCEKATVILEKPEREFNVIGQDAFKGCKDVKEKVRT